MKIPFARRAGERNIPRHAIYLLPNAFTTAALFAGFYAITRAIDNDWQGAAWGVLIAALLDGCDGRVARMTGTESAFGAEYDSLADIISFGAAPALLAYQWSLSQLGNIGAGAAFCFCVAAALRLARFNIQSGQTDRRFFIGIPCPAAAALLVSTIAAADLAGIGGTDVYVGATAAVVSALLALTMVSGVRYYSFKELNPRMRISWRLTAFVAAAAMLLYAVADNVMHVVSITLTIYWFSGYGYAVWSAARRRREKQGK
ncbi:MAG: CDP-diacylglycerol--serine O-phosphatidyltransferase [Gammaproteobacteria bacterium]